MKTYDVLVLKSVNKDMTAKHNDIFKYPKKGKVVCKDWKNSNKCGNGLHGFEWGKGNANLSHMNSTSAKWLVIGVNKTNGYRDLGDKVKFKEGYVLFCGTRSQAISFLKKCGNAPLCIFSKVVNRKYQSTVITGAYGRSISGDRGTSITGKCGISKSGYCGTSISGSEGASISGDNGCSKTGYGGKVSSGKNGILTIDGNTVLVDGIKIEPNTLYKLYRGEFRAV